VHQMQVVVIGGGAAGFFGAIVAARNGAQVTLLEAGRAPLAKVQVSGGGRCNVTHACFDPSVLVQHYPRGGKALRGAFSRFQPQDTINWYESERVQLKTEADGRMFPTTDNSQTIIDCLIDAARESQVKLLASAAAQQIEKIDDRFAISLRGGQTLRADRLLLATGGSPQGHTLARTLGHEITPIAPSLFTFNVKDDRIEGLAGLSVNPVHLRLTIGTDKLEQSGPLLITHWGLSGPAVLKLSAWGARLLHQAGYKAKLTINWLPNENDASLRKTLLSVKSQLPQRSVHSNCPVMIPKRLWESFCRHAEIPEKTRWAELSNRALNLLIQSLIQGAYTISGKGQFKEEFVTCGGINLKEVDFKTMESRICPGLYFAGELLDIDGVTGGFNFQSAWTTGWIAGQAMAQL
jgi:predicted Rossmann fold flavoprotein